jgi:cell division protease FtsH
MMRKSSRNNWWIWAVMLAAFGFFVLVRLTDYSSGVRALKYSEFMEYVEGDKVAFVKMDHQQVAGALKDGSYFEVVIPESFNAWDVLQKHHVEVNIAYPGNMLWYFFICLLLIGFPLFAWFLFRQSKNYMSGGGGASMFSLGKSKARMYLPSQIKTRFDSVAGAAEAKEDLMDVVDFLKHPEKYRRLGAKLPRGVLLVGAPGNGKTLLAKAVAGEANCRFFSISGSDFIEVFVGLGAARVRDLFEQARRNSPSIIFIDEIDAVGRQRGGGFGGGNDEREQTLNQLLTEMDGFTDADPKPVVVLAATNRPDVLDKALIRPGRFDRRVDVPYPDVKSREQILQVHIKGVTLDPHVNLHKLALGTPGFTGADLEALINEAAINASKHNRDAVIIEDFEESRDRMMLGKRLSTIVLSEQERTMTAYHEAGHALITLMMPEVLDPLHKVTIVPRGSALGVTHSLPERDKYSRSRDEMLGSIMHALGGRIAEDMVFQKVSTGAYSDFQYASAIARDMVCKYGMSPALGPIVYEQHGVTEFAYSAKTAQMIDEEVRRIIEECYQKAREILQAERERLDKLAHTLLEKELLTAQEIYTLLDITSREQHELR